MNVIDEIVSSWENDCKIDRTNLGDESLQTPTLHAKYLKKLAGCRIRLRSYQIQKTELQQKLTDYYNGTLSKEELEAFNRPPYQRMILKADLPLVIQADSEMTSINMKIAMYDEAVDLLIEIIKTLDKRSFTIKNALEWMRLTTGG